MINPFALMREARDIEKKVAQYVKEHPEKFIVTEEQFSKSTYKDKVCEVCNGRGSETMTDTVAGKHYYHYKCFELINRYSGGLIKKLYGGRE